MICFPNAKINTGLRVISKRPDNFHNIESILYPIPVYDILEIIPGKKKDNLHLTGRSIPGKPEDNLCLKMLKIIRNDFDIPPLDIILYKNIPTGSGLGGGSSDAASLLKLVNEFFSLELSTGTLKSMASQLGNDAVFFIENQPALATGTGTELQAVNPFLKGSYFCLVCPPVQVSTQWAYSHVRPSGTHLNTDLLKNPGLSFMQKNFKNDFETLVFEKYPIIENIKTKLLELGLEYVSLTGSGSTVFGISEKPVECKASFPADYGLFTGCL